MTAALKNPLPSEMISSKNLTSSQKQSHLDSLSSNCYWKFYNGTTSLISVPEDKAQFTLCIISEVLFGLQTKFVADVKHWQINSENKLY